MVVRQSLSLDALRLGANVQRYFFTFLSCTFLRLNVGFLSYFVFVCIFVLGFSVVFFVREVAFF